MKISENHMIRLGIVLAVSWMLYLMPQTAESAEIHIVHCAAGCPVGAPESNDLIIREIFALSSNDDTKFADWVAYRVTASTIGTSDSMNRKWKADEFLDESETIEPKDYKGANGAEDYDRGHQAPLAAFAGTVFWRSTNILSNITPQKSDLNQGPWRILEDKVRDIAYDQREVYVVTGPFYESGMGSLPQSDEEHVVPSGYWKIVTTPNGRLSAFAFDQDAPRSSDFCDFRTSLADIEGRIGLTVFPDAPDWPSSSLDSKFGC